MERDTIPFCREAFVLKVWKEGNKWAKGTFPNIVHWRDCLYLSVIFNKYTYLNVGKQIPVMPEKIRKKRKSRTELDKQQTTNSDHSKNGPGKLFSNEIAWIFAVQKAHWEWKSPAVKNIFRIPSTLFGHQLSVLFVGWMQECGECI